MATPHATGVAALADRARTAGTAGARLRAAAPNAVRERLLERSAHGPHLPGAAGGAVLHRRGSRARSFDGARAWAAPERNGFYGEGIVNAWGAVR